MARDIKGKLYFELDVSFPECTPEGSTGGVNECG